MKIINIFIVLLFFLGCNSEQTVKSEKAAVQSNKVLFLCTSEEQFNGFDNGTYLSEIAVPIYEFHKNDIEIDVLSPKGGAIPIYHKFDTTEVLRQAINSTYYQNKVANSIALKDVDINAYKAVIVPGGYGQFKDLHNNAAIKSLIVKLYENGGVIGSLGHGTALLSQLKLSNGNFLVNDVTMTCFPNWNELNIMEEANKGELLPFLTEDELKKNGANLKIYDNEAKTNDEVIDMEKRIVTASFASSGKFISKKVLELIK